MDANLFFTGGIRLFLPESHIFYVAYERLLLFLFWADNQGGFY